MAARAQADRVRPVDQGSGLSRPAQLPHHRVALFKTYFFVQRDRGRVEDQAYHIKLASGVNTILRPGPMDRYSVVPNGFVKEIQTKDVNGYVKLERSELARQFEVGETLRMSEGPFIGFPAIVESILRLDEVGRIVLLKAAVQIFGRGTPVEFEDWQVEKMR